MAITRVNSVSLSATGTTSAVITIPVGTGIQAGDLIIANCVGNGTHVANGMTVQDSVNLTAFNVLKEQDESSASSFWQETKYYRTPGAIADGSTITVTDFASATVTEFTVDIFRGCSGLIDQAAVSQANAASTSIVSPALGANATAGALVLSLVTGEGATTLTQSTMTTGSVGTSGRNSGIAYVLSASGSSTYTNTWTQGVSGSWAGTTVSFSAGSSTPAVVSLVNQWPIADTGGYAPTPVLISNTEGNALVAVIAAGSDNVNGFVPRLSISDDAHNWWTLAGSQVNVSAGVARRLDVWVCENARAATVASITASMIYAGISGNIVEVSGGPQFVSVDFVAQDAVGHGTATTLSGTAASADFVMSVLALFGSDGPQASITYPAALTTTFLPIETSAAATDMSDVQLYGAFDPNIVTPGGVSAAWSWASAANIAALLIGFNALPQPPVQPNPNYPAIITEAAFGFPPADQTGANPTWTNLSLRTIDDAGNTTLSSTRGRDYELTQPEAGELDILLNNQDGAFNPVSGSFSPNVLPEVPVRSSMYWNGRRYGIGFSYATSWPQTFPTPQWGFAAYTGKDALGVIAQGSMPSAYAGEVLADLASTYYPLGEFYENPHGEPFGNLSRFNQRPMIGWSPSALPADYKLSTGGTLGLLGDSSSGIGVAGIQSGDTFKQTAGGVFVRDSSLPQFWQNATGIAYEFWTTGGTAGIANAGPPLFAGYGTPWNYASGPNLPAGPVIGVWSAPAANNQTQWFLTVATRGVTPASTGTPISVALTGSGSWTVPAGVTSVTVYCIGPGAGGNGGSPTVGGSAGAAGAFTIGSASVTPGGSIPYVCGAGGKGGAAGRFGSSGSAFTSWNGGTISAAPATVNSSGVSSPGSTGVGTTTRPGGSGGTATGTGGAGGGSSPSTTTNGQPGQSVTSTFGGNGGGLPGGASGGRGGNAGMPGGLGAYYGSGGGGGGAGAPGAAGTPGVIYVNYTATTTAAGSEIVNQAGQSPQAAVYHVILTAQLAGSFYNFGLYVNGQQVLAASAPIPVNDLLVNALAIGPVPFQAGVSVANNYTDGQLAVYPSLLNVQRILSHYNVGLNARQNAAGDTTSQRVSALMQWSGLGIPYGIALSDSMAPSGIGNADQVQGSALADALYSLTIDEGGMFYCPATATGEVWYVPRQAFYNKQPKAILGDNPTDVTNGNPNFNNSLQGWTLTNVTGTETADATVPGGNSATFTVSNGSSSSATALYSSPVTAGQTYMLNGYIEPVTPSATNLYTGQINWLNSVGGVISTSNGTAVNLPNGAWTLVNAGNHASPVTAPAGAVTATFGPVISVAAGSIPVNTQFKAGQFWLTCVSSEVPYDPGTGFDYSDTFLYNIVSSQRTASTGTAYFIDQATGQATTGQYSSLGADAVAADVNSEVQYFPRGPLQLPIETASDQDAYDRVNWSLAAYKQPQLRANEVSINLVSNPGAIDTVMRLEQGDIVTVNRRPAGAPMLSLNCMIQKIEFHAGPDVLTVVLTLSPYFPGNAVLQLDGSFNATIGNSALPW